MTRPKIVQKKCPNCGTDIECMSPFSLWLRNLASPLDSSNFDNENLDYIWFCYRPGWLITIEEKTHAGFSTTAQQDTHHIVEQLLTLASGNILQTWRGKRRIEYRGHFIIRFSHTNPDDSTWIHINGKLSNVEQLKQLLLTGGLP